MNSLNSKLMAVGAAILVSACSAQDQVSKVQDNVQTLGGTQELLGVTKDVNNTLNAVKSGDFDQAQQEFSSVQQGWKDASAKLNTSPEAVNNIKGNLQTISTGLKASPPDKDKLVSNLQTLSGSLGNLAQGKEPTETAANIETEADQTTETAANTETGAPIGGVETPESTDNAEAANNLLAMKDALAETNTAVESNDYSTAKTSFLTARQTWFKFGGIVKDKSADSYQTLDQGIKTVNTALNQPDPEQNTLLTDLETLTSELNSVSVE